MHITAFSMIKNEEDIVEQFIRHTLTYCDQIYIYDHFSTDYTRQIIRACREEGLKVFIINDLIDQFVPPTIAHIQGDVMNMMLRVLYANLGDGVYLPLDADEFVIHEDAAILFRSELHGLPDNCYFEVPWRCLIATDEVDDTTIDPIATCYLAQKRSSMLVEGHTVKSAIKIDGKIPINDVVITSGNHTILCPDNLLAKVIYSNIYYLHAPIRSHGQVMRKTILGWLANVIRRGKVGNSATHWGKLYHSMIDNNYLQFSGFSDIYIHKGYAPFDLALPENVEAIQIHLLLDYQLKYGHLRHGQSSILLRDLEEMMHKLYESRK